MKTKAKTSLIATSLACVALSSALCMTGGAQSALAEQSDVISNESLVACEQALTFVKNDLESIVNGYNRVFDSDWAASEIEYTSTVYILDADAYGIYVDLDGDNGYFVMSTDYELFGIQTRGDLDYLRGIDNLYYHSDDGFMYIDGSGRYQQFRQALRQEYTQVESLYNTAIPHSAEDENGDSTIYEGQASAGDGKIDPDKIEQYVNERYSGYGLTARNINLSKKTEDSEAFEYTTQNDLSYYLKLYNNSEETGTENNCHLTAMYNLLRDWAKRKHINVPYSETYDMSNMIMGDVFYNEYGTGTRYSTDKNGSYKWETNTTSLQNIPQLYNTIRGYAISKGYGIETGYDVNKVPATMEYVMRTLYKNKTVINYTVKPSAVMSSIDSNRACFISIKNSSTYNDHGAAVVGYYQFSKTIKVDDYTTTTLHKYFYLIADGQETTLSVFDPNTSANPTTDFYYLSRC